MAGISAGTSGRRAPLSASSAGLRLSAMLRTIARTVARRMIVVVVTDEAPLTADQERALRRLRVQHDVLWLTIRDADPVLDHAARAARRDVDSGWQVPDFLHGDAEVVRELTAEREAADARRDDPLFELDARAYDLWALGAGLPQGMIYRQGVSVV